MGNVSFKTKDGRQVTFTKKHDPTARLKKLAGISKPKKERKQKGGIAPLAIGCNISTCRHSLG